MRQSQLTPRRLILNPDLVDAYAERAAVYQHLGNLEKAFEDLDTAITIDDQSANLYHHRAYALWADEDNVNAIADIDKAIELDPDNDNYYNMRALIFTSLGAYGAALEDIANVEERNEGYLNPGILDTRGYIYIKMAEYDKAKADFDEIFDQDLRFPYALLGGGIAYAAVGNSEEARSLLEDGLSQVADIEFPGPQLTDLIEMAEKILEAMDS